jgi:NAD(P)H-hydrate repair Nnr-like enzyme with NAD(P)H-hydrate dehydratase domain
MLLICGTVPIKDLPLIHGEVNFDGEVISIHGKKIPSGQGSTALISASCLTNAHLNIAPPHAILAGDIGDGAGSRLIYEYLIKHLSTIAPNVLVMHYILPVMTLMKKVHTSINKAKQRPVTIADASSMYAAKAAGLAQNFDMFTPDFAELAFLADPDATHPAYIRKHLFTTDNAHIPDLIHAAYAHKNASKILLVKGKTDYIVEQGAIKTTILEPNIPVLEAIGGTGDTITGMAASFAYAGFRLVDAATIAARANRMAGKYAKVTPATRIREFVCFLPEVFKNHLGEWTNQKGA